MSNEYKTVRRFYCDGAFQASCASWKDNWLNSHASVLPSGRTGSFGASSLSHRLECCMIACTSICWMTSMSNPANKEDCVTVQSPGARHFPFTHHRADVRILPDDAA